MSRQKNIFRRFRDERGFTLIEALVGAAMTVTVIFVTLPILEGADCRGDRIQKAAAGVGDARVFSDRVLRDLRSASAIVGTPTPTSLTVDTMVRRTACGSGVASASAAPAIECQVSFVASNGAVSRVERPVNGASPSQTLRLISGLGDDDIFSYSPSASSANFVELNVVIPNDSVQGDAQAISLKDGTTLRNLQ